MVCAIHIGDQASQTVTCHTQGETLKMSLSASRIRGRRLAPKPFVKLAAAISVVGVQVNLAPLLAM